MEFQYYYLVQDIPGVLVVFFSIRLILLTLKSDYMKSMSGYKLLFYQLLAFLGGINLLINKFTMSVWLGNMVLIYVAMIQGKKVILLQTIKYNINKEGKNEKNN